MTYIGIYYYMTSKVEHFWVCLCYIKRLDEEQPKTTPPVTNTPLWTQVQQIGETEYEKWNRRSEETGEGCEWETERECLDSVTRVYLYIFTTTLQMRSVPTDSSIDLLQKHS